MKLSKIFFEVILRRRSTALVVRKTDDELARYVKQTKLMQRRSDFEKNLNSEIKLREEFMNTKEIRQQFYQKNYEMDHGKLNDEVEFQFLTQRSNYAPLGQRFRFIPRPFYAKHGDWHYTSGITKVLRVLGGLVLLKLGYDFGSWDSQDQKLEQSVVVDYEADEQIFDELINKKKTAVFLQLYTPGHIMFEDFNRAFERESSKYKNLQDPTEDIVFMRVNCRRHLNFCSNKMFEGRILPAAEVYFINDKDQIELVDIGNRHRSPAGIESFFIQNGLWEDKLNPEEIFQRVGKKLMEVN